MSPNKDILTEEIQSWGRFGYALREENRLLFRKMLNQCRTSEYVSCVNAKGENFSAEALFLILILEQQKMINELIGKLSDLKKSDGSSNMGELLLGCSGWNYPELSFVYTLTIITEERPSLTHCNSK